MQADIYERRCEFADAACSGIGPDPYACRACPNRPQRCLICGAETSSWPFDLCKACRRRGDKETIYLYYVRSRHTTRWLQEVFKNKPITQILGPRGSRLVADLDGWVEATFKRMTGRRKLPSPRKPSRLYQLYRDGLLPRVASRGTQPPKDRREAWRWLYVHSAPKVRRFLSILQTANLWATFKQRHRSP